MFALLRPAMQCTKDHCAIQPAITLKKILKGDQLSDPISSFMTGNRMRSIADILRKNFHEDNINSGRFPGFPGVVDTVLDSRIFVGLLLCLSL